MDWRGICTTLWRRKLLLVLFVLVGTGGAFAWLIHAPAVYRADVQIVFEQSRVVPRLPGAPDVLPPTPDWLKTQTLIIKSREIVDRLVTRLRLDEEPEFNPALRTPGALDQAVATVLSRLQHIEGGPLDWMLRPAVAWLEEQERRKEIDRQELRFYSSSVFENASAAVGAEVVPEGSALRLSFQSTDPARARDAANELAGAYVERLRQLQSVAGEIERLRSTLVELDARIEEARAQRGRDADVRRGAELDLRIAERRADLAEARARLRQVEGLPLEDAARLLDTPVLSGLRAKRHEVDQRRAELGRDLGLLHPQMVRLQQELAAVGAQMLDEVEREVRVRRNEVVALGASVASLEAEAQQLQARLREHDRAEEELAALVQRRTATEQRVEGLLAQHEMLDARDGIQGRVVHSVGPALLPRAPVHPKQSLVFGIAVLGSVLAGALVIFGLEALDDTFRSSEQIETSLGLHSYGLIPEIRASRWGQSPPHDLVLHQPNSAFGEAIRRLRTDILLTDLAGAPRSLLVTSSIPNEAKSTTALCLARVCERSGRRTLIVNCDLRCPRLHELLGVANRSGLGDVLEGDARLGDVVRQDGVAGAWFVSAGRAVADPAAALASDSMRTMLREAAGTYDLVILDSPPVQNLPDAEVLSALVDRTLFAVRWGSTPRKDVLMAVRRLVEAGAALGGVLLTRVDVRRHARYGYIDSGYYHDDRYMKYYSK